MNHQQSIQRKMKNMHFLRSCLLLVAATLAGGKGEDPLQGSSRHRHPEDKENV
jgi:hypothetical protein